MLTSPLLRERSWCELCPWTSVCPNSLWRLPVVYELSHGASSLGALKKSLYSLLLSGTTVTLDLTTFNKSGFYPYTQAVSHSNPLLLRLTEWRQRRKTLSWLKRRIFLGIWAFAKELKRKGQAKSMLTFSERADFFAAFFRCTWRTDREANSAEESLSFIWAAHINSKTVFSHLLLFK